MRKPLQDERRFVTLLVGNVQQLVTKDNLTVPEKLEQFQEAIRQNVAEIGRLHERLVKETDETVATVLRRRIKLRENATTYLVSTARWLTHREECPNSLRARPRIFASPTWASE